MVWKTHTDLENSDPLPNSGTEWPCKPIVESSGWATKWPNDSTKSKLHTPSPTPEDEAANKAQLPALLTVAQYLNSTLSLDDEDEFSEYIGEDGVDFDEGFVEGEEGLQDYDFFLKLFKEDDGLREYYEKNKESGGVFCCLVCCGVREKGWKRFKDCSSLVQHAITIAKTSKRRAHRAYCKVVCEILGWDVNKLPAIVLSDKPVKAAQHSINIAKTSKRQAHRAYCKVVCEILSWDVNKLPAIVLSDKPVKAAQGNADDGGEDFLSGQCKTTNSISISDTEVSLLKLSLIDETQQGKDGGSSELEENSVSKCKAGVDGLLEDLSYLTLETHKGASGCVEPSKECPVVATEEKESQKDDADHKNHK